MKSGGEIAPLGSFSTDFEWRMNLKVKYSISKNTKLERRHY